MLLIALALLLLVGFIYIGWSLIWVAPMLTFIVALAGGLDPLTTFTDVYLGGLVSFFKSWFPVFFLGSILGALMESTGSAREIGKVLSRLLGAKRAILGVLLSSAVLTYGGISLFVVIFTLYPLAYPLFREADISRRLIPAVIALGAFTFTMTAIPGSPQIQNLIPTKYFSTTPTASPWLGTFAAIFMAVTGYSYLVWREKQLRKKGEGFTEAQKEEKPDISNQSTSTIRSFLPLIMVVASLNLLHWDIVYALGSGILLLLLLHLTHYRVFIPSLNEGARNSIITLVTTSSAVGFGSVVTTLPTFPRISRLLLTIGGGNAYLSLSIAIILMAVITGSASGGLSIALDALGTQYLQLAKTTGIHLDSLHRIATLASGAIIPPHSGGVITYLTVTGFTHRQAYPDLAFVCVLIPTVAFLISLFLVTVGIF